MRIAFLLALFALPVLAAPAAAQDVPPPPAAASPSGGGISAEEYRRVFPPAPVDVRAKVQAGVVTVTWSPPVAVAVPSGAYDPIVAGFRIYRLGAGGEAALIGETTATVFQDRRAPAGTTQRYAIRAVQRSGQESGLSAAAEVRVP